jgi:hypothetical protein
MNHLIDTDRETVGANYSKVLDMLIEKCIRKLEDNSYKPTARDALKAIQLKEALGKDFEKEKVFWDLIESITGDGLKKASPQPPTLEAQIIKTIIRLKPQVKNGTLPVKTITDTFNRSRSKESRLTYHRIGRLLSSMGFRKARTRTGAYAILWDDDLLSQQKSSDDEKNGKQNSVSSVSPASPAGRSGGGSQLCCEKAALSDQAEGLGCELSRHYFYPFPFEQRCGHPLALFQLSPSLNLSASAGGAFLLHQGFAYTEPLCDLEGSESSPQKEGGQILPCLGPHRGGPREDVPSVSLDYIDARSGNGQSSQDLRADGDGLPHSHQLLCLSVWGTSPIIATGDAAKASRDEILGFVPHRYVFSRKRKTPICHRGYLIPASQENLSVYRVLVQKIPQRVLCPALEVNLVVKMGSSGIPGVPHRPDESTSL